ncbi:MAG TPA: hypothetical protein VFA39_14720 [Steroidobacteraceae bacterium]|nr:hypothetical protein [Steroidobacteraceae bacterium]
MSYTRLKKQEEHGGFALDDTNVMLLVSRPSLRLQGRGRSRMDEMLTRS